MGAPDRSGLLQDMWSNPWARTLLIAVTVAVVSWAIRETAVITQPLLQAAQTALIPLAIGFTLAYVLTPVVDGLQRLGVGRLIATSGLFVCLSALIALILGIGMPAMLRQSSELWARFFEDIHYYDHNGNGRFDKGEVILTRVQDASGPAWIVDRNADGLWQMGETRYPADLQQQDDGVGVRQERSLVHQGVEWAHSTQWRMDILLDRDPDPRALRFLVFYDQRTRETRESLRQGLERAEVWTSNSDWSLPPLDEAAKPWNPDWPGPSIEQVHRAAQRLPQPLRDRWLDRMVQYGQQLASLHQTLLSDWRQVRGGDRQTGTRQAEALRAALKAEPDEAQLQGARELLQQLRRSSQADEQAMLRALYQTDTDASNPLQVALDQMRDAIGSRLAAIPALLGESATTALDNVGAIIQLCLDVILVPIYAFFLMLGMPTIRGILRKYVPNRGRDRVIRLTHEVEKIVAAFFRGRLIVCLLCGILVSFGFLLLDVPYAVLFGMAIGLATAIPLSGLLFLAPIMLLVAAESGDGLFVRLSLVVAVYTMVQTLEATVFTPWIMGREVELHPVVLILALVFLGHLLGILGLLLAVPIAAMVRILLREFALPIVRALAGVPPATVMRREDVALSPKPPQPPEAE